MHRALGTLDGGGALRFSVGPFNTAQEIDRAVEAVAEIAAMHSDLGS
jgi:cysteine sulfinate desulfinase/cysteine desulfurase-like protein